MKKNNIPFFSHEIEKERHLSLKKNENKLIDMRAKKTKILIFNL